MQASAHCVHHLNSLGSNPPKRLMGIEKMLYMRGLTSYRVFIYTPEYKASIIVDKVALMKVKKAVGKVRTRDPIIGKHALYQS